MANTRPSRSRYHTIYLNEIDDLMFDVLVKEIRKNKKSGDIKVELRKKITIGSILRGLLEKLYEDPAFCEEQFGVGNFTELVNSAAGKRLSK